MGLAYDRAGSGPPLVLLHGLGHRRQGWAAVLDLITPQREVITVDLPGHGQSPPLQADGRHPVQVIADRIAELLSGLGIDRPHVAGNSLGGTLALTLAAAGHAASVTALSPAGFPASDNEFRYAKALFTVDRVLARAIMPLAPRLTQSAMGRRLLFGVMAARPGQITPGQVEGDVAGFVAAGAAMRIVFAASPRFTAQVPDDVPVTIAWGTSDRVLPQSNARVARRQLPQARFVPLPGCGHVPMTDDPALIAKVLLEGSQRLAERGRQHPHAVRAGQGSSRCWPSRAREAWIAASLMSLIGPPSSTVTAMSSRSPPSRTIAVCRGTAPIPAVRSSSVSVSS
jgi:pimeloyl-ACP methyl ester carboxylesterase